ncbi:putative tetratricopeptide-like helical domain, DYW domain-containing protein [Rosa chinensis]|uniref:Putative tetratricopeptide-like helical domain, DYW domain-containing protein n=1 Tax=Rosa chinensis TaxID=74649 RepID=A0A2P6P5N9_ROSCH|nr:pentatricopeptide repeat-containing protein At1g08070, chloroplastic [Rosa chinensis]PRQ17214.1 putative tetratricopeptide-like helical domain, DYW domain-containing protein [Rosa chinensis]
MVLTTLPISISPAKALTAITVIPQFPQNPKTLILHRCKTTRDLNQVHAHLIKTRLLLNPAITENLLESAALILPNAMDYALSIFDNLEQPDSLAYNIIIRSLTFKQSPLNAIVLFNKMVENSVQPDEFTFSSVLKACSRVRALGEGEQVHAHIVKCGFKSNGFVVNTLIHVYATCGELEVARQVFDGLPERNVMAWNSMLAGYVKNERWGEVVELFRKMLESDIGFDGVTLISVLTACGRVANLELGEWIGEYIEANGLKGNIALVTSLVDMYAKCGKVDKARRIFDGMDRRDVIAWSAMISGYGQANRCREALDLFHDMQKANVDPNEVTMVSVLYSCGVLGALDTGKWIDFYVKKKKMKLTVTLGTALIDFYAKCGCVDDSVEVFNRMPSVNVFSWTALIQGLASNGQGKRALEYFKLMQEKNIKPNDVTFIAVLSACSHAGLVDEGRNLFVSMNNDFGIEPRIEHYGSMVDILGRAGLIEEAYQFIRNMPIQPNAVVWRTLLASCRAKKNVEIGEEALQQIIRLENPHSGDYILLSNIYASAGRRGDALRVRNQMKEERIEKVAPGCSLIQVDGTIYEFFAENKVYPHSEEVYNATHDMMKQIEAAGYVPNTADGRLDAEEDDMQQASVSHHSEKLAIAFGLIRTRPGTTLRILKNLRVCTDCHNATKIISKVFNREIIVRDWNRFHHFKEGSCSCNDYW